MIGSLVAATVESNAGGEAGPVGGSILVWLGAAALSGVGLAIIVLRDLRRLRREVAASATSRDRLSRLLDAAPVGLAFFDSDGRQEWCNEFWRSVEPVGGMRSALGSYGSGAQPAATSERRLVDGRWIAVRRTDLPDGGFIGLVADITEEKEREADLHAQAERLRFSVSTAGEWIWETDVLHRVASVTPLRADIDPDDLGWMVGLHLVDLAGDDDGGSDSALDACLRDMDAHRNLDNVIVTLHDGVRSRRVRLSGIPAYDGPDLFLGYTGIGASVAATAPDPDVPDAFDAGQKPPDIPVVGHAQQPDSGRPRLLVVEDSETNRMLAAAILRRMGYEADLVENGRRAVEAVQETDYGAILMDVWMPEMGGLEATAKIRALPAPKNEVPIVAMTGHVNAKDRIRCLDAGMDEHLAKPIDRRRLAAILRDLIGEGGEPPPGAPAPDEVPATTKAEAADEIDDSVIEQLRADAGPQIVAELIVTYMVETDQRLERMAAAVKEGRLDDVAGDAHAMKSSSGTFGAVQLQMLAARIEAASTNRERKQVETLLAELPALVSKTWQAFASRGFSRDGAG